MGVVNIVRGDRPKETVLNLTDYILDTLEYSPELLTKEDIKDVLRFMAEATDFDDAIQEFCDEG